MSDTKTWRVGDLCRERGAARGLMSRLRVVDADPVSWRRDPWYEGRVEVECGTDSAYRYRGYFPLAADLEPLT